MEICLVHLRSFIKITIKTIVIKKRENKYKYGNNSNYNEKRSKESTDRP